jgi:hypothetical protein
MSVAEKLRRLSRMSLEELRFRAAQRLRIEQERIAGRNGLGRRAWWEHWNPSAVSDEALREAFGRGEYSRAADLLPGYLLRRARPRFFFSVHEREAIVAACREMFPWHVRETLAEADAILAHRFRVFAYPEAEAGAEIPWRRDLVHGTETPLAHWSEIPYLDFARAGDSKIVWELNRHQHFLALGQAWLFTADERYAAECAAQFESWCRANPARRGINWASSLELAFRVWSWLWALWLLGGSRAVDGQLAAQMSARLAEHAEFIAENLSVYFSPNTHLLGEGFGLFALGLLLPELHGAEKWRATGRRILEEEMEKQVRADGSHAEQSSYYHRYAADFFLCASILADRNAAPFSARFRQRLERMCEFILHTQFPAGLHPMTGDADGGRVLAIASNRSPDGPNDQRATLSTAALYFGRGDFARAAGGLRVESLWLLGRDAASRFAELAPQPPRELSRTFCDAGLIVQRSGWEKSSRVLLFDSGPQGMLACGHGHADALQVLCAADGIEWLTDPGTNVYTSSREWRDAFRSTRSHNTLTVDGLDQAVPVDFFKWSSIPEVRLEMSAHSAMLDAAAGSHTAYLRLPDPVTHRRWVVFVKPEYWLIADELEGTGTHDLEWNFHFAPDVRLEARRGAWLAEQSGQRLVIVPPPGVECREIRGDEDARRGWHSRDYGHRQPASVLWATARCAAPAQFDWLLCPAPAGWPRAERLEGPGLRARITTDAWTDFIVVRGQDWAPTAAEFGADAEAALLRRSAGGAVEKLALVNGCCSSAAGRAVVRAASMLDEFCAQFSAGRADVSMRPARRFALCAPGAEALSINGRPAAMKQCGDWIEFEGE